MSRRRRKKKTRVIEHPTLNLAESRPVEFPIERRIRLLQPLAVLNERIELRKTERSIIHQRYFPAQLIESLVRLISAQLDDATPAERRYLAQTGEAGVRRVVDLAGGESFALDLIAAQSQSKRIHLEFEISKSLYEHLHPFAVEGYLRSERCLVPGNIVFHRKLRLEVVPVRPQIEVIQIAGPGVRHDREGGGLSPALDFAIITCEIPEDAVARFSEKGVIKALRGHRHDMPWLHGALVVTDHILERYLRSRGIATDGIQPLVHAIASHSSW